MNNLHIIFLVFFSSVLISQTRCLQTYINTIRILFELNRINVFNIIVECKFDIGTNTCRL